MSTAKFGERRLRRMAAIGGVLLFGSGAVVAQSLPGVTPEYVQAAKAVWSYAAMPQMLREWCDRRAPATSVANAAAVGRWDDANQAQALVQQIETALPPLRQNAATLKQGLFTKFDQSTPDPQAFCQKLPAMVAQQPAIAGRFGNELRILQGNAPRSAAGAAPPGGTPPGGTAPGAAREAAANGKTSTGDLPFNASQLDVVYFVMVPEVGFGGFAGYRSEPRILLKDGTVFFFDDKPGSPRARWKRVKDGLQIIYTTGKSDVFNPWSKGVPLPEGVHHIAGDYGRMDGFGSAGVYGSMVASFNGFHLLANGRFTTGAGSAAVSNQPGSRVVSTSLAADSNGRYDIDGYILTFHFDSGRTERTTFAILGRDSNDRGVIAVGGRSYTCNADKNRRCLP